MPIIGTCEASNCRLFLTAKTVSFHLPSTIKYVGYSCLLHYVAGEITAKTTTISVINRIDKHGVPTKNRQLVVGGEETLYI